MVKGKKPYVRHYSKVAEDRDSLLDGSLLVRAKLGLLGRIA
jgi:hypothetical protein